MTINSGKLIEKHSVVTCVRRGAAAVYIKFLQQYAETSRFARASTFGACAGESGANWL